MKFVYAIQAHTFNGKAVTAKEFLWGGHCVDVAYDPVNQNVAILDREPNRRTERCDDSNPLDVDREVHKQMAIRAATGQEIVDYDNAKKDLILADIDVQLAIQAIGKVLLDRLDQAITLMNQCRTETLHSQRASIQPIDRSQFWTDMRNHYKSLLP